MRNPLIVLACLQVLTSVSMPAGSAKVESTAPVQQLKVTGVCDPVTCDDGNPCNGVETCDPVAGCVPGTPPDCDDHNICTADSCDPTNPTHPCVHDSSQTGDLCFDGNDCTRDLCDPVLFCVFPPVAAGTSCNDFRNCTTGDACNGAGTCVGHSVCDDGQPCTDDFADEANNCACSNPVSFPGTPCDDGNSCTTGTTCDGLGGAVADCNFTYGGGPVNCDDNNPCTDDSCDAIYGCVHTPNTAPCDDGNACTVGDTCGGGTCNPGTPRTCDDGNVCNGFETCNPASGCLPGTPLTCDDGNVCNGVETCDPVTGCVPGTPLNCNDGNGCTDDTCNAASGCVHTNNTAPCNDGNICTANDHCSGGTCVPGGPANCDDGDCCTIDSCNPSTGCVHTANPTVPAFTTQPSFGNISLFAPNHGYVDFSVADTGAQATSACGIVSISFVSCASSQPENGTGTGDGNTLRDCVYEPASLHLRAERDGSCSPIGRIYTTQLVAVDACGHTALSDAASIPVWHDRNHPPTQGTVRSSTGNTQDVRPGTNGTYGTDCGTGGAGANGTIPDRSDADPEMEISQYTALTIDTLRVVKGVNGSILILWDAPVPNAQVTRYHVWKLDPMTRRWTQIAELTRTAASWTEPNDASSWDYKVTAIIK